MLSRTSREEILRKISAKTGFKVEEGNLSPGTRRAIENLAVFQMHLVVVSEILNGEKDRVDQSLVLTLASRVRRDEELESHSAELRKLQEELASKVTEISAQVAKEAEAKESGKPFPEREGGLEAVQLKCPGCGAVLPMPTGRYVKCEFCGSSVSIQDVGPQMRDLIKSI